jgi:cytochrome P450
VDTLAQPVVDDDMFAPGVIADPYAYYGRLREVDPVHWNERHQTWVITRYDDATWVSRHPELFSSAVFRRDQRPPYPPVSEDDAEAHAYVKRNVTGRITNTDPPEHREQRASIQSFFATAPTEQWRPMIREAVARLLDAVEGRGRMDVMRDLAVPLPLSVIAEVMAIPVADRPWIRQVAEKLLIGPRPDRGRMREISDAIRSLYGYIEPLVEARLREPGEDLISLLCAAEAAGAFTRAQTLQNVTLFVVAGHETTINLICNGLLAFIRHPDQWARLQADPDGLSASATEECLRYDPPVKSLERIATTDVELRGRTIKAGDRARWFISSANRDPRRFPDPDTFDIGRTPNPHISFGHGIHLCLGAALARIEGQEVFRALAARFSRFSVETDPLEYAPMIDLRSLRSLAVTWETSR